MVHLLYLEDSLEFQIQKNKVMFSESLKTTDSKQILEKITELMDTLNTNIGSPSTAVYHSEKPGYTLLEKMKILTRDYGNSFAITDFGIVLLNAYRRYTGKPTIEEQRKKMYERISHQADHLE